LRNASTGLSKSLGFGQGYQYPHNFEGNFVVENYLPDELSGHRYYQPSRSGRERDIAEHLAALRKPTVE
jgi:putative ATPase